jgi:hypothetical protein
MASGFLDANYGVAEERRGRLIKRYLLWGLLAIVVAGGLYFYFRNWKEERTLNHFFSLLREQRFQDAYAMWGDDPALRKSYPPERFLQDWGPTGEYGNIAQVKVENEDVCGANREVWFTLTFPGKDPIGLVVERGTYILTFAPEIRCPGRHLHLKEFLKSVFG